MWKDSIHAINIERESRAVESVRENGGREREQERVWESVPNKGKQSAPLRTVVTVTVIECVSAAGESAPMVFVLSDGPLPDLWELVSDKSFGGYILALIFPFPQPFWTSIALAGLHPAGLIMRFAKSGSSRNSCRLPVWNVLMNQSQQILGALQVLQNTPGVLQSAWSALKCPPGFADVVLILDGHKSHENWELRHKIYAFSDCKVVVFCFPSKTTHKFQPLDIIVFSPVGHKWRLSSEQGIQLY